MDSFYDAPRRPPQPIPKETFSATPVVPEISVLCPSINTKNAFTPYSQWKKDAMPNNFLVANKENINQHFQSAQNNSILKKQVRFESPVLHQRPLESNKHFLNKTDQHLSKGQAQNDIDHKLLDQCRPVSSFEQMYMANIPNRQLDLSVIDLPKRIPENEDKKSVEDNLICKEIQSAKKQPPKTYREFLDSQKVENKVILNDSVTDIFNYKNSSPKVRHNGNTVGVGSNKNFNNQFTQISGLNAHQPSLAELRYGQNEYKKEPTQPVPPFQHVSEAISQRIIPVSYETVEQSRGEKNTTEMVWPLAQNTDYRSQHSQNKLFFQGNNNQDKSNPQEMRNIPRSEKFFPNSISQDPTKSKQCIDTVRQGAETKNGNSVIPTKQVDNGSQTTPSVLGYTDICVNTQKNCEFSTQTSNSLNNVEYNALKRCDHDFSVKDLVKIIAQQSQQISQQNEQLLLLQKQVSMLICQKQENECTRKKSIQCKPERNCCQQQGKGSYERARHCCSQEQQCEQTQGFVPRVMNENMKNIQDLCITSTQHENCDGMKKKFEGPPPKTNKNIANFSIGLTTSFEVSFRNPHYNKNPTDFKKTTQLPNFDQYEPPKIQEITETDSTPGQSDCPQDFQNKHHDDDNRKALDESMVFKEPIRVREPCPSPEPSIKINMNDFEESESEDDTTSPELCPSFYKNLMVQVNKILQKAQIGTTEEVAYNFKGQNLKQNTLHKVKEATLKHLRRIGVEVQGSDDHSESSNSSDDLDSKSYNQDDISFAVKQLLMKYLPADHLAKIAYKEVQPASPAGLTPKEKIGAIKTRPDFSFATVQYMQKYNLIAKNHKEFRQAVKQNQPESPKILDITKLKQQPKLL